jgi:hypothetical protein
MATRSIYRKLDDQRAILNVPMDYAKTLRPQDLRTAIGAQILDGSSCLVLMGTTTKAAITMAHISCVDPSGCISGSSLKSTKRSVTTTLSDVHYMDLLRKVVNASLEELRLY